MSDQLDSMIVEKNFQGILARLRNEPFAYDEEDSLCDRCLDIARAVYKEIKQTTDPAFDIDLCLEILQAMIDNGWTWSNRDDGIHQCLPLRREMMRLKISWAERMNCYQRKKCIDAAIDKGSGLTVNDLIR
jgi:hypothetical protein